MSIHEKPITISSTNDATTPKIPQMLSIFRHATAALWFFFRASSEAMVPDVSKPALEFLYAIS